MSIDPQRPERLVEPWILRPKPQSAAALRLFCFPYAGGGAAIYRGWPDGLPGTIDVCAVALPGRGGRLVTFAVALVRSRPLEFLLQVGHHLTADVAKR